MRRVLAAAWGTDASVYVGRSVRLYFDPNVTFGKEKPCILWHIVVKSGAKWGK